LRVISNFLAIRTTIIDHLAIFLSIVFGLIRFRALAAGGIILLSFRWRGRS